ncbi:hypothetical protein SUGI_1184680 [Cryptomeria japonica]|nr:hypothetical protein SUGI_1184680 [Cryptomeria japonica]
MAEKAEAGVGAGDSADSDGGEENADGDDGTGARGARSSIGSSVGDGEVDSCAEEDDCYVPPLPLFVVSSKWIREAEASCDAVPLAFVAALERLLLVEDGLSATSPGRGC